MHSLTKELIKDESYYQHDRFEMVDYVPRSANTILEVGCGGGAFGELIKAKQECEYWGIEMSESAIIAKKKLDIVYSMSLEQCKDLPENYFDCIVFNDVIEHLVDPVGTINLCKKLLKKDGYLVSSIPNIRHAPYLYRLFYLGEFEYGSAGLMDYTHLHFFTKKSIANMYINSGYLIIKHEGINPAVPKKFAVLLNTLKFLGVKRFDDTKYQQFATVAKLQHE
jgi:2-polyprenyl-3-methyl-5-hydroxy-6-metoxy-1,4-benzoquinol methylase